MNFALGAAIYAAGLASAVPLFLLAFRLAARYQRTGLAEAPAPAADRAHSVANPEEAAFRRVLEESVQHGADDIQRMAEEAGESIAREDAERQARDMLRQVHAVTPLGGVS